jgi:hypothetical protein
MFFPVYLRGENVRRRLQRPFVQDTKTVNTDKNIKVVIMSIFLENSLLLSRSAAGFGMIIAGGGRISL